MVSLIGLLLLQSKGDYNGAEFLYRRALEVCERSLGKDHPSTKITCGNLAWSLILQGKAEEAKNSIYKALEEKVFFENNSLK